MIHLFNKYSWKAIMSKTLCSDYVSGKDELDWIIPR